MLVALEGLACCHLVSGFDLARVVASRVALELDLEEEEEEEQ